MSRFPFDRFRSPFPQRPPNSLLPCFDMAPPSGPPMGPPFFMPPPFLPHRPFAPGHPRQPPQSFNPSQLNTPRNCGSFFQPFRSPPSGPFGKQPPLNTPQSLPRPHLRSSASSSSLEFPEVNHPPSNFSTDYFPTQNFSRFKSGSESNLPSYELKSQEGYQTKRGLIPKRKYPADDNQTSNYSSKWPKKAFQNETKQEFTGDESFRKYEKSDGNNCKKNDEIDCSRNNNRSYNTNKDTYNRNNERNYYRNSDTYNKSSSSNNRSSENYTRNTDNYNKSSFSSNNSSKQNSSNKRSSISTSDSKGGSNDEEMRIETEAKEWQSLLEDYKEDEVPDWVRCSHADLYFKRNPKTKLVESTTRMKELERCFEVELLQRASNIRKQRPPVVMPERYYNKYQKKKRKSDNKSNGDEVEDGDEEEDVGDGDDADDDGDDECDNKMSIIAWKNQHPELLHSEMWYNLHGEMNDGPLCRCSKSTRKHGIRHNIYPGEECIEKCSPFASNPDKLFHYKITMSPHTNFLTKNPTVIHHDDHEYIFEGFSLFSHYKIQKVPDCKVIRFNIEYTIHWFEEDMIENFDVRSLDLFSDYIYREIMELVDLDWIGQNCGEEGGDAEKVGVSKEDDDAGSGDGKQSSKNDTESKPDEEEQTGSGGMEWGGMDAGKWKKNSTGCRAFHLMPRFSRNLPDNGKEILSMNEVLKFLLESNKPLMEPLQLGAMTRMSDHEWQNFVDEVRGMIVTYPGKRPSSLRIDQLDRKQDSETTLQYPKIIHFGYRPAQLSYVGDAVYSKLFKQYMKLKYLVANKPKLSPKDREKLRSLESQLQEIRLKGWLKREMTVEVSSENFFRTGLKSDICQHALLLPVLMQHLRFHKCLDVLETSIGHHFNDRLYLQMAMTHPSFRMNYGTNPDHARNSLSNCGMRQLEYGDRHIHYIHTRKRGIKTLIHIMSKMARSKETASEIHHYERLEFLGDTVIEFLSSIHLFFLFPRLEEGGLATFRAALVQNQHLTVLAQKLGLQHFLLYAHGPDLCRDSDLRYALANCFEALMGSLYLDGGIEEADRIFGEALFKDDPKLHHVWVNLPSHRLQEDEPLGDRHWIEKSKPLQKLVEFEDKSGIRFRHIRLLARAFTMRNIGYNNLSLGHNQTLEFLGDTILQFITSDYLFRHFPDHHEGHLTLLRSSLVNNKTQAIICDDLGMTAYVINNDPKVKERMENEKNKVKDKADILEAFMGALYVDQGLDPCIVFCQVCFYPRLKEFIMNQDWNDAKSQLQQCCLTLRDPTEGEPDIPIYKVLQCTGPTNTRKYHVAVYFKGERMATGVGHSIQQGEMEAAKNALKQNSDMFPHLLQTKQYLDWRFNKYFNSHVENKALLSKPVNSRFKIDRRPLNKQEGKK